MSCLTSDPRIWFISRKCIRGGVGTIPKRRITQLENYIMSFRWPGWPALRIFLMRIHLVWGINQNLSVATEPFELRTDVWINSRRTDGLREYPTPKNNVTDATGRDYRNANANATSKTKYRWNFRQGAAHNELSLKCRNICCISCDANPLRTPREFFVSRWWFSCQNLHENNKPDLYCLFIFTGQTFRIQNRSVRIKRKRNLVSKRSMTVLKFTD